MGIKSIDFMKNFDFKESLKLIWVIIILMALFLLIDILLPKWCLVCAYIAFILLCLYCVGRKKPHYWFYIKHKPNVSSEVGVIKTYEDKTPIGCIGRISGLMNIVFYEISREHYEALNEVINKANEEKQVTDKNDND